MKWVADAERLNLVLGALKRVSLPATVIPQRPGRSPCAGPRSSRLKNLQYAALPQETTGCAAESLCHTAASDWGVYDLLDRCAYSRQIYQQNCSAWMLMGEKDNPCGYRVSPRAPASTARPGAIFRPCVEPSCIPHARQLHGGSWTSSAGLWLPFDLSRACPMRQGC